MMADVSDCRGLIPKKYFETHDYEDDPHSLIPKNKAFKSDGTIPLDLAFCRWATIEAKVTMMPGWLF